MSNIDDLIKQLGSPNPNVRYEACEYLRVTNRLTDDAIAALENVLNDPDPLVAEAAKRALNLHRRLREEIQADQLQVEPPKLYIITKRIDAASGFVGWFLINGLVWGSTDGGEALIIPILCFSVNVITLFILAAIPPTRWIALGILAAWAINFILSMIFGVIGNGSCLVPFFIESGW